MIAVAAATGLTQLSGDAQTGDALPYSRGYLVTGNYVAAGVNFTETLNPPDSNGISTGTINIAECDPSNDITFNCVPNDADIVAAYLYWEMILPEANPRLANGVTFRGEPILLNDLVGVKASTLDLTGTTSSCWSSGSPLTMVQFRADVLRFLPIRLDRDNKPTGKRMVTDDDLGDHNLPLHSVTLPTRNGNQIPESAGASLVLVYRDLSEPLRKIVVYDGIYIQPSLNDAMTQTIRGFYQSAASRSAKITHIIGSGQPNNNELVRFNNGTTDTPISPANPAFGGSSSQRAWSTLTYDVSTLMNPAPAGASLTGYGETVTTTVAHSPANGGYDCLAWGAVIFSTAVADRDHDGLPDGIEDSTSGLTDPPTPEFPTGQPLPNLHAMGSGLNTVSSTNPDVFVEINAMQTTTSKDHGSVKGPYPGVTSAPWTRSVPKHTHMPTPQTLALVGQAYWNRGIHAHFDVGDIGVYKNYNDGNPVVHPDWEDVFNSPDADLFLIPTGVDQTRGGEVVDERTCNGSNVNCILPGYPGAASWKVGLQVYRDAPVANDGTELTSNTPPAGWNGRRRFDRNRKGLFHYVLYAHYRGKRRSDLPCVNTSTDPDTPIPYPNGKTCNGNNVADNPDYYRPTSGSGVADLPGGNAMITLGFWDDFVARPFVQASTTFHELGHNYNLWHGGIPALWGDNALNTPTYIEPNCKPNYLSSMSYLFQVHGLYDDTDEIHLDFSGTHHDNLVESNTTPSDGLLNPVPNPAYRTAWYAPFGSALATSLGVPKAKRYCHGEAFGSVDPLMARVYTLLTTDGINWDGAGGGTALPNQDINFDHDLLDVDQNQIVDDQTMLGYDDWASLRLDQISAGRNAVKFQDGDLLDFGSGDLLDFGSGDLLDFGSGDLLDFGSGDLLDFGSGVIFDRETNVFLDLGSGDLLDFGSGDLLDFGSGDLLDFGSGTERQELDFELAKDLGRTPPYSVKGCVITELNVENCETAQPFEPNYHRPRIGWKSPAFGRLLQYEMTRRRDAATTPTFVAPVPTSTTPRSPFLDTQELPHLEFFTYRGQARFDDNVLSGYSRTVTIQVQNLLPVPNHANGQLDAYTTTRNRTLTVSNVALGVRGNDDDPDSPRSAIVVQSAPAPPNSPATLGTVTLNANGTFTYRPQNGFVGTDYFYYTATNGTWTASAPQVPMNGTQVPTAVQVVVQVTAK